MSLPRPSSVLVVALRAWRDDGAASMGAALAYYTLFSIGPALLIATSVAGIAFEESQTRSAITLELTRLLGPEATLTVLDIVDQSGRIAPTSWTTTVGALLMVFGATTFFSELQHSLDRIWNIAPTEASKINVPYRSQWFDVLKTRVLSFGLILAVGMVLIISLAMSAASAALNRWSAPTANAWAVNATLIEPVVSFALTTMAFALIYKVLPSVRVDWGEVLLGSLATAALFTLGKWLIGLYLGDGALGSAHGAAGPLFALLIWLYYSAQIFLFGAELTWAYAQIYGSQRVKS